MATATTPDQHTLTWSLVLSRARDLRERGRERSGADPRESVRVVARRAGDRR